MDEEKQKTGCAFWGGKEILVPPGAKIDGLQFVDSAELARLMGCSVVQARQIMHRRDFPAVKIGKAWKVSRLALAEWASTRRE